MIFCPYQVFSPRLPRAPTIIAITIVVVSNLIGSSISAAVSSIPPIPPGYSSEIIQVKFREGTDVRQPEVLLPYSVSNVTRLFSLPREKLNNIKARGKSFSKKKLPNLNLWFQITLEPGTNAAGFIDELRRLESVEIAEPAPLPHPMPAITPDFTGNQGYLNAATDGIDARFSWTIPGGNGSEIKIYDVEYSWNQAHEDLSKASGVSLLLNPGDSSVDPFNDNNHGTAVLGELIADNDTKGVTGISWGANIGLAPANTASLRYNPANAILLAVANGSAGDVILIEQQFPVCGLPDFGPLETVTSVFDAIQTAVANRVVVVEAAGNGGVNLDQAACGTTFDRTVRDSGAIIVGAGGSPGSGLDRQRLSLSSYGSRVDVQGWGDSVATTGYGGLYVNSDDPTNPNFWYTGAFSGTSSASPIVTGAVANLQGIALKQFGTPLTPFQVRQLLVETGSPQLGDTTERIGPRPNLRQAIDRITVLTVTIDIKPGSFPNAINPRSKGVIPVAIVTTDTFDATTVDPLSVKFGPNGATEAHNRGHIEDADGDGDNDMVLHFRTQETGIKCGDTSASLTGKTVDGQDIEGSDSIQTVGCK